MQFTRIAYVRFHVNECRAILKLLNVEDEDDERFKDS